MFIHRDRPGHRDRQNTVAEDAERRRREPSGRVFLGHNFLLDVAPGEIRGLESNETKEQLLGAGRGRWRWGRRALLEEGGLVLGGLRARLARGHAAAARAHLPLP